MSNNKNKHVPNALCGNAAVLCVSGVQSAFRPHLFHLKRNHRRFLIVSHLFIRRRQRSAVTKVVNYPHAQFHLHIADAAAPFYTIHAIPRTPCAPTQKLHLSLSRRRRLHQIRVCIVGFLFKFHRTFFAVLKSDQSGWSSARLSGMSSSSSSSAPGSVGGKTNRVVKFTFYPASTHKRSSTVAASPACAVHIRNDRGNTHAHGKAMQTYMYIHTHQARVHVAVPHTTNKRQGHRMRAMFGVHASAWSKSETRWPRGDGEAMRFFLCCCLVGCCCCCWCCWPL